MLFFFRTLLLFSLSLQVVHADFNDGRAAALVGDYNTAHAEWLPLAEQGHIDAQFYIGLLNSNQLIDQALQEQAVRWYLLAANNGHVDAQFNLGIKYDKGIGVEQSDTEAFNWYFKAAKSGHPEAQFNLANTYRDGRGVEANMERAVTLYKAASFNGVPQAQANLALSLHLGSGVEQDNVMAYVWASVASEGDSKFTEVKDSMAQELTDSDIQMGDVKTLELTERLASLKSEK